MQEKKSFSRVLGTGGYLPGKPVTNQDLVNKLEELDVETSDEWIKERSGITSRHFCGKMSTRDMGCIAAKKAIEVPSTNYPNIVDMEASHIYASLIKHLPSHRLVFLKIISDHMDIQDWKKIDVDHLITKNIPAIKK